MQRRQVVEDDLLRQDVRVLVVVREDQRLALPAQAVLRLDTGEGVVDLYGKSYALVVGASAYKYWPKLPGVKKDVALVKAALEKHGFEVTTLMDPTRTDFDRAMREFMVIFTERGLETEVDRDSIQFAERMVLELGDKLPAVSGAEPAEPSGAAELSPIDQDVLSALLNLGCARPQAEAAVRKAKASAASASANAAFEPLFRRALELVR